MSMDPIGVSKKLYDFLEMEITKEMEEFLKKSTTTQDSKENHEEDLQWMQVYTTSVNKYAL